MKEFEFTVEVIPKAKARPRFVRRGKVVQTYTPKSTLDYEKKIAEEYLLQGGTVFDYPYLEMSIIAYFPIPKSTKKVDRLLLETECVPYDKHVDLDNCIKAVMDAVIGIAYLDDKQVVSIKAKKYYGKVARVVIRIREIEVDGGSSQIM